jgi:hypothetical protein
VFGPRATVLFILRYVLSLLQIPTRAHYLQIITAWTFIHNTGCLQCLKKAEDVFLRTDTALCRECAGKKGIWSLRGKEVRFLLTYSMAQKSVDTVFMSLNIECEVTLATRCI